MRKSTAEMIKTVTNTNMEFPQGEEQVNMCLAIQQMQEESEARGLNRGRLEGRLQMLFELVRGGLLTVAQAAANAKLTEDQFRAEMLKAGF